MTAPVFRVPKDLDSFQGRKWLENLVRQGNDLSSISDLGFVLLAADALLPNARVISSSTEISVSDGGAGSTVTLELIVSGVSPGTYTKVTVDSKGRITVGATASTDDISEGSNLYYTDARVLSLLSGSAIELPIQTVTASSVSLGANDYSVICDCSSNPITVNLPTAVGNTRIYNVKKVDSSINKVTIDGNGAELIDNNLTQSLFYRDESMTIQSDGSNWWIL